MKYGQRMELRKDTRPPKTRERGPATGVKAMWWPQNPDWNLVQWLPREQGSDTKEISTTAQGKCLRGAETSPQQRRSKCNPEGLMVQATAEKLHAGQDTTRSPRIRQRSGGNNTDTPWNQKKKASEETRP